MNDRGKIIDTEDYGENVLIVEQDVEQLLAGEEKEDQATLFE